MSEEKQIQSIAGKVLAIHYVNFPNEINGSPVMLFGDGTKQAVEEYKKKYGSFEGYNDIIEIFLPTFSEGRIEFQKF
jgi:hypothetical protein